MRVNLHTATMPKGKGPFHGHELRLTIALIVKNEEKDLDKCLLSLKPLLNAMPSELIITDTGSTDHTVEIAQKYTDHIIHFDWCDDFAAARNTGLFAARGEWFMFIDGDEWFEDTTPIIEFFNSGECDQYWTATYRVRNYNDFKGLTYADSVACRLFRLYPGIHFQNKIHEDIMRMTPTKIFDVFAHHYGYVFHNATERNEKYNRNLTMLVNEIKENPTELKAYAQIIGQYYILGNFQEAIDYGNRGLEMEKKAPNRIRKLEMWLNLIKAYFAAKQYQNLVDKVSAILNSGEKNSYFHLDILRMGQESAFKLKNFRKTTEFGEEYLVVYQDYEQNRLDKSDTMYAIFDSLGEDTREKVIVKNGFAYVALHQTQEAIECVRHLNLSIKDSLKNGSLPLCFSVVDQSADGTLISKFWCRILDLNDEAKRDEFITFTESYLSEHQEQRRSIERALANVQYSEDDYIYLNRLRLAEIDNDRTGTIQILDWFSNNGMHWNSYYSDILYYALKEKINMLPFILQIDVDDLTSIVKNMQKQHSNFVEIVTEYFKAFSFENVKALYWTVCLMERAILAQKEISDEKEYLELFKSYSRYFAQYVRCIYRQEMFQTANLAVLPRACRFGFYMGEALHALDKGDRISYFAGLRNALKEYPIMEKPVQMLLENYETEQKDQEAKAKEFQQLAKQVKQKIENLIMQGDMNQAGQVTRQLAKLMPNDEDVRRYQRITNTSPTMVELASHLPQ